MSCYLEWEWRGGSHITHDKIPLETILWDNWIEKEDDESANRLVEYYMYLVNFHVERIAVNLPSNVNRNDLESFAFMGLFDALKKFEPARELKFDTYASFRIRGSIMDGLRKEDWLPRLLRDKVKQIERISQELLQEFHRTPTSEEIGRRIGISAEEVETIVSDSLFSNVLSIDGQMNANSDIDDESSGYVIPDDSNPTPIEHVLDIERKEELIEGIRLLNDNEKNVISLFYNEELTMTEIGEVLDLTTSRISQIHKTAIFKLRKSLQKIQNQI